MHPEELIGQVLGHYRLVRPLGIGGTSTVFLAQDIHLQREVAIKVFRPKEGETQDFLRRFAREARVVAQLDHPNILPVYDYGEQNDLAYLVMPQMPGGSLRDLLRTRGTISPQETVQMIGPVLKALQYAHDRGLIHRDIKPGNMLFKADGTIMLSDFGLVKVTSPIGDTTMSMNQTLSTSGQAIAGTPDYMSPEQVGGQVTPASDIYSMGIVLYEMLTGKRPFSADNYLGVLMKQMYEQPRPPRELNPQIPLALEAVVLRALNKDTAKRYQRPEDLRQALVQAIAMPMNQASDTSSATITATPYLPGDAPTLRSQSSGEHPFILGQSSEPVSPASPTAFAVQPSIPSTPSGERRLYQQSIPTTNPPVQPSSQQSASQRRRSSVVLIAALAILLVLIGGLGTALLAPQVLGIHTSQTPTPSVPTQSTTRPAGTVIAKTTPTTPPTVTTQNVGTTTTACPAPNTARAAVLAPLALGNHQNLVYVVNQFNPTFGTIKRRDANANLKATEVIKMADTVISEAQVSQDGQWVLFTAKYNGQYQIRMVRVDGQGLQTLYCAPTGSTIGSSQWSFDQQAVIFDLGSGTPATYLLNINSGALQAELVPQSQMFYAPRTWLDNTHIYLVGLFQNASSPPQGLYLLDTQKGANQHDSDLQKVVNSAQYCTNFDTSYDSTQLFVSSCAGNPGSFTGPSSITVQPTGGGTAKTIYSSQTLAATAVRAVTPTTLLVMIENQTGDTSQNGLWKMNTDGTGMTRLSTDTNNSQSLCPFTQYAWSNVSPDSTLYALQAYQPQKNEYSMSYGSLNGGSLNQFADISDGTQLYLAGWTRV